MKRCMKTEEEKIQIMLMNSFFGVWKERSLLGADLKLILMYANFISFVAASDCIEHPSPENSCYCRCIYIVQDTLIKQFLYSSLK